ncbi:MAG TPA: hypothetical protein VHW09_11560 [Bryobacteraceae bacterium]|nr:hypothetical protein [Bryobacteraceae bacterium]
MRKLILLSIVFLPSLFGQASSTCNLVKQDEADALMGGASRQVAVGNLGCGYSLRTAGLNLSITVMDMGTSAKTIWDSLKDEARRRNWLIGEEPGMGSDSFAELIKRSAESSAGKAGFVVLKGTKVLQIFVTDSAAKADIAGKKEMLDKMRPVAQKAVQRL